MVDASKSRIPAEKPIPDLLKHTMDEMRLLASKEFELAKAESRAAWKEELVAMKGLATAAVLCLIGLSVSTTATLIGLFGWKAAAAAGLILILTGSVCGYFGWRRQIKTNPVPRTQSTLKEDARWIKEALTKPQQ